MQELDTRTMLTIISVVITVIGMFIAWLFEIRKNRYTKSVDATGNKLLPFYSSILELIVKYNLFIMSLGKLNYSDLKINTSSLYDRAGTAFVYIRENEARQFTINVIQAIESIDILSNKINDYDQMTASVMQVFPYLIKLKDTIEEYIETYSKIMNIPKPDKLTIEEIRNLNSEDLVVNIFDTVMEENQDK